MNGNMVWHQRLSRFTDRARPLLIANHWFGQCGVWKICHQTSLQPARWLRLVVECGVWLWGSVRKGGQETRSFMDWNSIGLETTRKPSHHVGVCPVRIGWEVCGQESTNGRLAVRYANHSTYISHQTFQICLFTVQALSPSIWILICRGEVKSHKSSS